MSDCYPCSALPIIPLRPVAATVWMSIFIRARRWTLVSSLLPLLIVPLWRGVRAFIVALRSRIGAFGSFGACSICIPVHIFRRGPVRIVWAPVELSGPGRGGDSGPAMIY